MRWLLVRVCLRFVSDMSVSHLSATVISTIELLASELPASVLIDAELVFCETLEWVNQ